MYAFLSVTGCFLPHPSILYFFPVYFYSSWNISETSMIIVSRWYWRRERLWSKTVLSLESHIHVWVIILLRCVFFSSFSCHHLCCYEKWRRQTDLCLCFRCLRSLSKIRLWKPFLLWSLPWIFVISFFSSLIPRVIVCHLPIESK